MEKYKTLNNGVKIPCLGFGTGVINEGSEVINSVTRAIQAGYTHIDTAYRYYNEAGIGIAIKDCIEQNLIKREDLFITTKVSEEMQGYNNTLKAFNESIGKLGLDYVDLYLIHSPNRKNFEWKKSVIDTWRALETLYKTGKVKSIGVSNFSVHHLEYILSEAEIKPMINQIELHPQHQKKDVVKYCKAHGLALSGWGTLNQGNSLKVELLKEMAKKYNRTPAQISIRWSLQKGFIPLVRATEKENIIENYNVFDFEITSDDMEYIDTLDGQACSPWEHDNIQSAKMISSDNIVQIPGAFPRSYTYMLFGLIPIFKKRCLSRNKTKYYLFGFLPIIKITIK
jgi:diketogulonate reductase-like aldo/keto reductase